MSREPLDDFRWATSLGRIRGFISRIVKGCQDWELFFVGEEGAQAMTGGDWGGADNG
jgi:hypothetical protein